MIVSIMLSNFPVAVSDPSDSRCDWDLAELFIISKSVLERLEMTGSGARRLTSVNHRFKFLRQTVIQHLRRY